MVRWERDWEGQLPGSGDCMAVPGTGGTVVDVETGVLQSLGGGWESQSLVPNMRGRQEYQPEGGGPSGTQTPRDSWIARWGSPVAVFEPTARVSQDSQGYPRPTDVALTAMTKEHKELMASFPFSELLPILPPGVISI